MRQASHLTRFVVAAALGLGAITAGSAVAQAQVDPRLAPAADPAQVVAAPDRPVPPEKNPPNVVIFLTDDQRDGTIGEMPSVQSLLQRKGVQFTDAQSPTSTCCPARASLYTGNLARTTGVWTNWPPYGGWEAFHAHGNEPDALAVRMQEAGYQTALSGKYLNDYAYPHVRIDQTGDKNYIPPGWDSWWAFGMPTDNSRTADQGYFDYYLMERPTPSQSPKYVWYGHQARDYSSDVFGDHAVDFIQGASAAKPLFLVYAPYGPHAPYTPPPRYAHARVSTPPVAGFGDTAGKPSWITLNKPVTRQRSLGLARNQARCLKAVDDNVRKIIDALQAEGRLQNTLLVFLSDNGLTWGEFNILGQKNYPYTTDIPMLMRWDSAPGGSVLASPGTRDGRLVSITDVTTTILKAAGASTTGIFDGLDLSSSSAKRSELLISAWRNRGSHGPDNMPAYCGIRTPSWLYVRYGQGYEELYDLKRDPHFLSNLALKPGQGGLLQHMRSKIQVQCDPAPPGYRWNSLPTG